MPSQPEEYTRDVVALTGRFQPALAQPRMERYNSIHALGQLYLGQAADLTRD